MVFEKRLPVSTKYAADTISDGNRFIKYLRISLSENI